MADGADLILDGPKLDRDADRLVRRYLAAGTRAVVTTTRRLEQRLEAATAAGGAGRLAKAWASDLFPEKGPARDPAGTIYLNGGQRTRGAVTYWTEPGSARRGGGQYYAVPLPAAGPRGRARNLTPGDWERAHPGRKLDLLWREPPKLPLLVAVGTTNARTGAFRRLTKGRRGRAGPDALYDAVVPIFVLMPVIRFRGSVSINQLVAQADGELAREFFNAVRGAG